ncbi:phage tail tip fiber protein, partial [Escherichia coli]|uniref:phage tail tip fiber protein n=1 Tax=Escherichia coli TaxID=562 RepID=UPI00200A269F
GAGIENTPDGMQSQVLLAADRIAMINPANGNTLHHIPEQLSKRERYTDKWQRRTHSLWRHRAWRASAFTGICNDLAAASTFV